tara:strand:+ start:8321 stop:10195 length:1875 start_codon:yes stop_codon:yes gene_type:complete
LNKSHNTETISQKIKLITGREPNEEESSFLNKWRQMHFAEKLISSLIKYHDENKIFFSVNHSIAKSPISKKTIEQVIDKSINDIQCKNGKAEKSLLFCRTPHSDVKGVKEIISKIQKIANSKKIKTFFSFSSLDEEISIFAFSISGFNQIENTTEINEGDLVLLFSSFPKNQSALSVFLENIASKPGCVIKRVEPNDVHLSIASFSRFYKKGITINNEFDIKSNEIMFVGIINKRIKSLVKDLVAKYKISLTTLGSISSVSDPVLRFPSPTKIDLPISCLDIFNDDDFNSVELINDWNKINELKKDHPEIQNSFLSYNDVLLKLIISDEWLENSRNSIINTDDILFSFTNEANITNFDTQRGAQETFSKAIRRIVCYGGIPELTLVGFNIPDNISDHDYNYIREFDEGIKKASSLLEIPVSSANVSFDSNLKRPFISVIAKGRLSKNSHPISSAFKSPGDFILILGSHRGELGCSLYARIMSVKTKSFLPMIDLVMERQIRQVILTGNEIGIIKSVIDVSVGGLSTSIANSIVQSGHNFGAKIHLSSKIENEELLFGETKGLMIITISEESIIEIERLCMNLGVPCTTIGRVTDNGHFSFNDLIDINCDNFIQQITKSKNHFFI